MSLPSLKLNFFNGMGQHSSTRKNPEKFDRLVKLEKSIKQSEEEISSRALMSMRGTDGKSEVSEEQAFPARDTKGNR